MLFVAVFGLGSMFGYLVALWWIAELDRRAYVAPPVDRCPYCRGSGDYADVPVRYWLDGED